MKQLKISIIMLFIFTVITGVIYPVFVTGLGRILFNEKINGSLKFKNGVYTGSELIGQSFEKPEFFHGRPSSVNYNPEGSGASNMGPTNKKFAEDVKNRIAAVKKENSLSDSTLLPPDIVFASGSGLDPHISVEAAKLQTERISSARKIDNSAVLDIINSYTEKQFYFYGNSYVNVLKMNLALADKGELK
jgi:K+-transporting ATPase ATPase C chain